MKPYTSLSLKNITRLSFWKKLLAFSGPGYLVAVGYMDPGNWATDLAGGSMFGYKLLFVIFVSNIMAILLQYLSLKLGIVTDLDLAQACRHYYSKPVSWLLWILAEIAIIACDLAEVIGSAIALNLLFHIPLLWGVIITAGDVLLLLLLENKNFRTLETIVIILLSSIAVCFGIELFLAKPIWADVIRGFIPTAAIITNPEMLFIALGILGATVMPHNLYLHSSIVKRRVNSRTLNSLHEAIHFMNLDSMIALCFSFFINAAILIVSAAVFYTRSIYTVAEIQDAYQLLTPLLGTTIASTIFALALLLSGQNATITGTLAGQIIMEGFVQWQLPAWLRRLISRCLTIIPAALGVIFFGEHGLAQLLLISQVVLSLQLPFAIFPLLQFTNSSRIMGPFKNSSYIKALGYFIGIIIVFLNSWLIYTALR